MAMPAKNFHLCFPWSAALLSAECRLLGRQTCRYCLLSVSSSWETSYLSDGAAYWEDCRARHPRKVFFTADRIWIAGWKGSTQGTVQPSVFLVISQTVWVQLLQRCLSTLTLRKPSNTGMPPFKTRWKLKTLPVVSSKRSKATRGPMPKEMYVCTVPFKVTWSCPK